MKEDADTFKEQDEAAKEAAEKRNQGDQTVHQARKLLSEHEDKIEAADKESVEDKIKAVDEALQGEDLDAVVAATEALQAEMSKLGEKLYSAASNEQAPPPPGAAAGEQAGGASPDDVVDADYEVKD
jgi:molecular chaperone DnaK